ncbi:MAG: RNA-dependent RNA polymerase [brine shrimp arlivirus 8]|nr:MAG: RNA-dependent RNA polymerase [brine shrimp arlivirus 8]UNI74129.1 MAG: RNA-dependent RNA polymerase [brine shrimp arlivirus 8]UNI74134.1 MAG: RNA-dependent RNA polymerase [brine shrimp arlivirus 8]UNI74139.1 MAG: RNA-dependent RNA polymerase [brine shrimp arlivirus 8]
MRIYYKKRGKKVNINSKMDEQLDELPPVIPRFSLDNPILPHNRRFLLSLLTGEGKDAPFFIIKESLSLKNCLNRLGVTKVSKDSEKLYSEFFSPTLVTGYSNDKRMEHLNDAQIMVWKFLNALRASDKFPSWASIGKAQSVQVVNVAKNPVIVDLAYWSSQFSSLRNSMATLATNRSSEAKMSKIDHPYRSFVVVYSSTFAIWVDTEEDGGTGKGYVMDYDQICGIADTIEGRLLSLEASLLHHAVEIQNMPSVDTLTRVYLWGDKQLRALGNDGYKVLKTFESILRTLVLRSEPYDYCRSFHRRCLGDLQDILADVGLPDSNYQELVDVLDVVTDLESAELSGVYRHWMHPTVNEENGMKKVKNISKSAKNINFSTVDKVLAAFNRTFVLEYIAQHRRWPKVHPTDQLRGPLKNWVNRRSLIMDESAPNYHWTDWKNIGFSKEFEFDYKLDLLDLLDDKACCLPKKDCHKIYYKKFSAEDKCKSQSSRRVLLELLKREDFDTKEIIRRVCQRDIPDDWKAVGLHPKEREMKMEPRLYAILPIELRAYFVLTEANIAKHIFKYFPQQTMNLNADQLDRRLLQMSQPSDNTRDGKKRFTANLDFKSWNIYWTKEAVESIFLQIGCLFGMPNLITFTHEFFEMAMLFLSSYANPPENWTGGEFHDGVQCDCHLWFGHFGGLEGLRQKGWTLITVAMLEVVKLDTNIDSLITGQGDNQVIIFFIHHPLGTSCSREQLEQFFTEAIKAYIKSIADIALGMGQHLKVDETWVSSRIVEYGKDMLIDGVFLPAVLKKVSRAFEVTNEISPGLQSQITHIFSVMQAACAKGLSWIPLYVQALFTSYRVVLMHLRFDQSDPNRGPLRYRPESLPSIIKHILFIPRSIGGLAALPFTEFILRGHPDPVTSALVHMSILERHIDVIPLHTEILLEGSLFDNKVDYLMLATAPDSLNIKQTRTEQNIWKSLVRNSISTMTKNPLFLEVANAATKKEEENFVDWMSSITPVFPRFLSLVYTASIFGAMSKVIGSFGNNRTLVFASGAHMVNKSLYKIRQSHNNQWSSICSLISQYGKKRGRYISNVCLSQLAQSLRDRSWLQTGKPSGIYGSTVPHPLEQFVIRTNTEGKCRNVSCCYEQPYIFFQIHQALSRQKRCMSRGLAEPYLSGRIRAKREQGLVHTTTLDSPITAAAHLASNRASVTPEGSVLDQSLKNIVKSRTDLDINIVESLIGKVYGGTLWHRLPDTYTSHVVSLNCRPNITTHVYPSTDTMLQYSKGAKDYTLPFQSIFVLLNSLLSDASARGTLPDEQIVMHAHLNCLRCTQEIIPIEMHCLEEYIPAELLTTNPLIKSSTTTLPLSSRDLIRPPQRFVDTKSQERRHRQSALSHQIVQRYLTNVQVIVRGLTVYRRYRTDLQLRMADILSIGAIPLIHSIACQLIALSPILINWNHIHRIEEVAYHLSILVNVSGSFIWQNVGQFATLPEFVNSILSVYPNEDPGMDYGRGGSHTFRFLNRILIKRLYRICGRSKPYNTIKGLRLYLSDPHWIQNLYWAQHYIISSWLISTLGRGHPEADRVLNMSLSPNEKDVAARVVVCMSNPDMSAIVGILQEASPRVRTQTPEADSRFNGESLSPIEELPTPPRSPISASEISSECKLDIVNCQLSLSSQSLPPVIDLQRIIHKSRRDHEFKTVGHSSTAMYKWTCVLQHLSLSDKTCMTLGEGAGGLARGLLEIFRVKEVVFNSLIDSKDFDPHRLTSFIPAELRPWVGRVRELEYCREHGGDLMRLETVNRYSNWENIELVTCDAEVSEENIEGRLQLVDNVITIAVNSLSSTGRLILKTYGLNLSGLYKEVEKTLCWFQNVRVFYTIESSFENYEVFIEAWGVLSDRRTAYISQDTMLSLSRMSASRTRDNPFQVSYPVIHQQVQDLLLSYRPTNLNHSLQVFSNELVGEHNLNKKQVKDLQMVIILFAEERLRTHKNLIGGRKTHGVSNHLVGAVVSEKSFLASLSVWYINLEILYRLLDEPTEKAWDTRLEDFQPTSIYFNIPVEELDDYEQRYSRHFYHILGLLRQM